MRYEVFRKDEHGTTLIVEADSVSALIMILVERLVESDMPELRARIGRRLGMVERVEDKWQDGLRGMGFGEE